MINYSDLDITQDHGDVASYADRAITAGEAIGDYFFRIDANGNPYLSGYIGSNTELILPENYKGGNYAIGKRAFYKYADITSITIPNSVQALEKKLFIVVKIYPM